MNMAHINSGCLVFKSRITDDGWGIVYGGK